MDQKFCTECGSEFAGDEKFCTQCGASRKGSSRSSSGDAANGPPDRLPMPDGLPFIDLSSYDTRERVEAIALINHLSTAQRRIWVQAGQPDILFWPGGNFANWLGGHAPEYFQAAATIEPDGEPQTWTTLPQPNNSMATAGFVMSMVSLFTFYLVIPPALGVLFSSVGLSRASRLEAETGTATGKGMAVAGLVISALLLIGVLGWLASF